MTEKAQYIQSGDQPLTILRGVGEKLAAQLARIGIVSCQDLIFHLPFRYEDRTQVCPVYKLQHGQQALILGAVETAHVQFGRRRSLLVRLNDGGARITMRLFYFNAQQQKALEQGQWVQCYGEARLGPNGMEMIHPEYRVHAIEPESITTDVLTPVYPTTDGVGQARMRKLVNQAFEQFAHATQDYLPPSIRQDLQLLSLDDALHTVHAPKAEDDINSLLNGTHPAQKRLALEELLAHHLALRANREERQQNPAPVIKPDGELWQQLQRSLGFTLTDAQQRVVTELEQDLAQASPGLRLVQGDVGSGKTVVAAAAALHAVEAGWQVAIMAPTELLAEQHRRNFLAWCEPLGVNCVWLTGRLAAVKRREATTQITSGEAQIAIGTHALFQDEVEFHKLGLIVVDEQHRFGVGQRLALKKKGEQQGLAPHQIIMSATPIPRSLSMVYYADMDVSNIDELPPGRIPVQTVVLANSRRDEVQQRVRLACQEGRQAYWVCPLIEESDALQAQAAEETAKLLTAQFTELNVGLVHSRMKPKEKDTIMARFRGGEINLLVATTVIEVGVDVPNASLMIIENAERLGLAQLHQLRGRVGRGSSQSVCVLMYQAPLGQKGKKRLDILRQTSDGFEIARHDLEQRGPGELMGTRQTGEQALKIANIVRDQALLLTVEKAVHELDQQDVRIKQKIIERWVKSKDQYAQV